MSGPRENRETAWRDTVWRFLRALGCTNQEADDLAQDAMVRLLRRPPSETAATRSWLLTVTRNLLIDLRRRQRRTVAVPFTLAVENELSAHPCVDGSSAWVDAARDCVAALPPRMATIVQMFYREDRTRSEIAAELSMTEAGVKTALQRARAALRDCIERKTCEPPKKTTCSTPSCELR